ncbi:hypothetical protein SLITO_v1c10210 [Spiroplasma litorale]|uniref:Uncharacterized protein n=1 Tax=Spiroplasma litorale TaxID=216942 RepID=A0A0K1W3E8_9MOLU|nr:hypothetical protein [Spiroplasma litorale]AKX34632.1 hypothetical protein SLITO_v1c10210 [Spiroplasma litorale]
MAFKTSLKYSLLTILKSKLFIFFTSTFIILIFLINVVIDAYTKISQSNMSMLFILDYIDVVLITIQLTVISIIFSIEFFYTQKKNGIKTIEVKNGMKIWQIFLSKLLSIIVIVLLTSFLTSTIIIILSLSIFNDNIYISKLIFSNLYLIFLTPLFLMSINLIMLSLNWSKACLIFSSFFLGVLSLFNFFNAFAYDFDSYASTGTNYLSNYDIYYNYNIWNFKKSNNDNNYINKLSDINKNNLDIKNILYYDDKLNNLNENLKNYYESLIYQVSNDFYKNGNLFQNVNIVNDFNKKYLLDKDNYVRLNINNNVVKTNFLIDKLNDFDIVKNNYNINEFSALGWKNTLLKPTTLIKELNKFIKGFEKSILNDTNTSIYYEEVKRVNELILNIIYKAFYFNNDKTFLATMNSSFNSIPTNNVNKYFDDIYRGDLFDYSKHSDNIFNIQNNSSAKLVYQGILFYIVNHFNGDDQYLNDTVNQPNSYTPNALKMSNYYTSPFLWLEFLSKYGFVKKTFDNFVVINESHLVKTNNLFKVEYEINENEKIIINDYIYKGPNAALLIFLIIIYSSFILLMSYFIYKKNFYK